MSEVKIPTGSQGTGYTTLSVADDGVGGVHVTSGGSENTVGIYVTRENFIKGVSKALDVTITPKKGTRIHADIEAFAIDLPKPTDLHVGYQITEYWHLVRARKADAVVLDNDDVVWAWEEDEDGDFDWTPAVKDQTALDDPDGLYITDVFPLTVIYLRGKYTDN